MKFFRCSSPVLLLLCLAAISGCGGKSGPQLARVSGKVTLGGQPLAKAAVEFIPEKGRPATGVTDDDGYYELQYTESDRGAMLGNHTVRIRTYREADEDAGTPEVPEKVPMKYNVNSELTRDVKEGKNEFNFELDATGPIYKAPN